MLPIIMCVLILIMVTKRPLKPGAQHNLFQDSKPEGRKQPPRRGMPLIMLQRDVMLRAPTADTQSKSVPEFFAVGKRLTTSLWNIVKGGGNSRYVGAK